MGQETHGKEPGSILTVEFDIGQQTFVALNGGPQFKFNESVSFQVLCETQQEIDYFWSKLTKGGEEGPCGWLKDKSLRPYSRRCWRTLTPKNRSE